MAWFLTLLLPKESNPFADQPIVVHKRELLVINHDPELLSGSESRHFNYKQKSIYVLTGHDLLGSQFLTVVKKS